MRWANIFHIIKGSFITPIRHFNSISCLLNDYIAISMYRDDNRILSKSEFNFRKEVSKIIESDRFGQSEGGGVESSLPRKLTYKRRDADI